MSRPLRIQYPDAWYHVMNRGRRGEDIFLEKNDYLLFIDLLCEPTTLWRVNIAAYCLMPNHYHLMIQTPDANLSLCMRHLNGIYTQRFNRYHHCDGHLFRGRYKSILIEADRYLLELVRYIHRNPVRAGLVDRMDQYLWSSHKGYVSDSKKWSWLYKELPLSLLSQDKAERKNRYKHFVSMKDSADIIEIYSRKNLPSVIGSERFMDWVKGKFYREKKHKEIPDSNLLAPSQENIKKAVCERYHVDKEDLLLSRRGMNNEPRKMVIYLMRMLRGEKLDNICKEVNMDTYSSVSSVIERMKSQINNDRRLRKRIEEITDQVLMSQGQT
jgi:putative transposase